MAGLSNPRPKKRVYQSEEAPFPVPIETVTKKSASDGHWFYYTGHLSTNCVLVKREGDIIFLYKMGFFGKGILSKSKPQHHKFEASFQGLRRKNLPFKERKFQQQRFQQVRHHKYERHLSWQKLLVQQQKLKQDKRQTLKQLSSLPSSLPTESAQSSSQQSNVKETGETSCVSSETNGTNGAQESSSSNNGCQDPGQKETTDWKFENTLHDIPSTSGFQLASHQDKGPKPIEVARGESSEVKHDKSCDVTELNEPEMILPEVRQTELEGQSEAPVRQREWMGDSGDVCDLVTSGVGPAVSLYKCDDVTHTTDYVITTDSDDSGEEFIIVSGDEDDDGRKEKTIGAEGEKERRPEESKETGKGNGQAKKIVRKSDPFKIYEYLQLSFEEAFFLSFGLGCLSVLDEDGTPMPLNWMWRTFCSRQSNFLPNYVVYHYLRSKGWVPKAGAKYGADFVLYKKGPPFYHASYSVLVNMIDEHSSGHHANQRFWNWNALTGMNRITENVAKEVLVCYVLKPPGIHSAELLSPKCLKRFQVQEVVMKRWVSSRERESTDVAVPLIS